jgi:hypothetical protein
MKKILYILIIIVLQSCQETTILKEKRDNERSFVVYKIKITTNGYVYLWSKSVSDFYYQKIKVPKGLYNIGDTVYIVPTKQYYKLKQKYDSIVTENLRLNNKIKELECNILK